MSEPEAETIVPCWECQLCGWQILDPEIELAAAICLCGTGEGQWSVSRARKAVPPRSWFYTSERLPAVGPQVGRFWVYWPDTEMRAPYAGYFQGEEFVSTDPGPGKRRFLIKPCAMAPWVYAYEPEPAAPPLPDAPREAQDA